MAFIDYGLNVGTDEVVLFPFDNYSIPFRSGLQLDLTEPAKYKDNPVLEAEESRGPDSGILHYYGSVIRIDGEFRMWYVGVGDDDRFRVCYATSLDGIHWVKPELGLVIHGGDSRNNIVDMDYRGNITAAVVIHEPEDPDPGKRFKICYEDKHDGDLGANRCSVAYSADGLVWKASENNPVFAGVMEQGGLIKYNGCYYVLGQGGGYGRRCMIVHASYDFEQWTEASVLGFRRDHILPRDLGFGSGTGEQVHLGASVWNRGNVIIGLYGQWHGSPDSDLRYVKMDLGMVISHDGMHYHEPIPNFRMVPTTHDKGGGDPMFPFWGFKYVKEQPALMQGQGFEHVGDETYYWYSGWHDGNVRLATWPKDRFGCFSVPHPDALLLEGSRLTPGIKPHFLSCPIRLDQPGTHLYLNADGLSENSFVTVELQDEQFHPIAKFSEGNCIPCKESGFNQDVKWKGTDTIDVTDVPIRVKVSFDGIRQEDARVYSVYLR